MSAEGCPRRYIKDAVGMGGEMTTAIYLGAGAAAQDGRPLQKDLLPGYFERHSHQGPTALGADVRRFLDLAFGINPARPADDGGARVTQVADEARRVGFGSREEVFVDHARGVSESDRAVTPAGGGAVPENAQPGAC
jgi:hypothetical protein